VVITVVVITVVVITVVVITVVVITVVVIAVVVIATSPRPVAGLRAHPHPPATRKGRGQGDQRVQAIDAAKSGEHETPCSSGVRPRECTGGRAPHSC
jgi:hypothetical protein